mmetsp:Transcript_61486/g.124770  ORF Transcript_61486/g.124770 Transcript_61486/m.124770 type:complete len:315 (+) Transcript_61486:867-1811(+)
MGRPGSNAHDDARTRRSRRRTGAHAAAATAGGLHSSSSSWAASLHRTLPLRCGCRRRCWCRRCRVGNSSRRSNAGVRDRRGGTTGTLRRPLATHAARRHGDERQRRIVRHDTVHAAHEGRRDARQRRVGVTLGGSVHDAHHGAAGTEAALAELGKGVLRAGLTVQVDHQRHGRRQRLGVLVHGSRRRTGGGAAARARPGSGARPRSCRKRRRSRGAVHKEVAHGGGGPRGREPLEAQPLARLGADLERQGDDGVARLVVATGVVVVVVVVVGGVTVFSSIGGRSLRHSRDTAHELTKLRLLSRAEGEVPLASTG